MGTIYFIEAEDGRVKIGWTSRSLEERLKELRPQGSTKIKQVLATMKGARTHEAKLHKLFANHRIEGKREWFYPHRELNQFVSYLQKKKATL